MWNKSSLSSNGKCNITSDIKLPLKYATKKSQGQQAGAAHGGARRGGCPLRLLLPNTPSLCFTLLGGIGCVGRDKGQVRKCLDVVEIYNPDGDFWREGPPMPSPLLSLRTNSTSAGAVDGKLYVCGGFHGAGTSLAIAMSWTSRELAFTSRMIRVCFPE